MHEQLEAAFRIITKPKTTFRLCISKKLILLRFFNFLVKRKRITRLWKTMIAKNKVINNILVKRLLKGVKRPIKKELTNKIENSSHIKYFLV